MVDPKERAEHVMLIDLGRNDVGRVSEFGSVKVTEQMVIERYSHVMHIVSHVVGRLREDQNAFDAVRATFPAGTVSGAPKIRAMQIIAEFEKARRGFYSGIVGYFGFDGSHDSCIAIRSIIVKDRKGLICRPGQASWPIPTGPVNIWNALTSRRRCSKQSHGQKNWRPAVGGSGLRQFV